MITLRGEGRGHNHLLSFSIQKLIMTHIHPKQLCRATETMYGKWYDNKCSKLQVGKGPFRRKMPSEQVHWDTIKQSKRQNRRSLFMKLKLIKAAVIFCSSSVFLRSLKSLHISEDTLPFTWSSYKLVHKFELIHENSLHICLQTPQHNFSFWHLKIKSATFCTSLNVWFQILYW